MCKFFQTLHLLLHLLHSFWMIWWLAKLVSYPNSWKRREAQECHVKLLNKEAEENVSFKTRETNKTVQHYLWHVMKRIMALMQWSPISRINWYRPAKLRNVYWWWHQSLLGMWLVDSPKRSTVACTKWEHQQSKVYSRAAVKLWRFHGSAVTKRFRDPCFIACMRDCRDLKIMYTAIPCW